jgi:hypothetical protein
VVGWAWVVGCIGESSAQLDYTVGIGSKDLRI